MLPHTLRRVGGLFLFGGLVVASVVLRGQNIPAFPGAEGYGAHATGGRGGDVYYVTTTNRDGAGSLKYGIETASAVGRTIVSGVSGFSNLNGSYLHGARPNITIAGQTAPGDGFAQREGTLQVRAPTIVVRHLCLRHGRHADSLNVVNHGTMRFTGRTSLKVEGIFENPGILDLITAGGCDPANFINHGVVLDSSLVRVAKFTHRGDSFAVDIQSHPGRDYQLQRSRSLTDAWEDIGPPQVGDGQTLSLEDLSPDADGAFYALAYFHEPTTNRPVGAPPVPSLGRYRFPFSSILSPVSTGALRPGKVTRSTS
jgi:hypothetical protein